MYTRFYDQVLTEISGGEIHAGINLLVGMLDTVGLQAGSFARAQQELREHSLGQMLRHDPLCANADTMRQDATAWIRMIADKRTAEGTSSTGRRLFAATSDLTLSRALRGRRQSFDQRLERAKLGGQETCLLGGGLEPLPERNSSNITMVSRKDAAEAFHAAAKSRIFFDFILAPDLADQCEAVTLTDSLRQMRPCLSDGGTIVIAALHPHHIGAGWRRACLNWEPECHDEQSLERAAASAGLTAKTYRDETDCVVWGELRLAQNPTSKGGKSHGN